MRVGSARAWFSAVVVMLAGCTEHVPSSTTAAAGTVATAPVRTLPPPTRVETPVGKMRYFFWEPAASVADLGADGRARAEAVLASPTVRELLGAAAGDGFTFERHDAAKHMFTFRQTREFRGRAVIVDGAYATVELAEDTGLVYLGTGFQAGLVLADGPLTVDEAQAEKIAAAAYEAQEKFAGKATPHRDPGLRVQQVRGMGPRLVYSIHVERAEGEAFSRPFMFVVDAQSGEVVHHSQSWIE
jgi:hypothetical protein